MAETGIKQTDAFHFGCPGCGSSLRYDIRARGLHCTSCGQTYPVTDFPDESLSDEDGCMAAVEYVCPQCGAAVHTTATSVTSFCSFCGADVVLTERLARTRRPSLIVPFRICREQCESIYREKIKKARFAPPSLLEQRTIDRFRPIYIPFWRYKGSASGPTSGSSTNSYSDSKYDYVDSYSQEFNGTITVSGVLYDASSAFEDETAQKLGFRSQHMQTFHPAYLSGMYAESPDTSEALYAAAVKSYAKSQYSSACNHRVTGSGTYGLPKDFHFEADLILLPVWLLATRQGDQVLYTAINGESGAIVCDTPVSRERFIKLAGALFVAFLALLLLLTHTMVLRHNILLGLTGVLTAVGLGFIVPAIDRILVHRISDTDPTRLAERVYGKAKAHLQAPEPKKTSGHPRGFKIFLICFGAFFLLIPFFAIASSKGWNGLVAALISERSKVPAILLGGALISTFFRHYTYLEAPVLHPEAKAGKLDVILLRVIQVLLAFGILITLVPVAAPALWNYGVTVLLLVMLIACMLRLSGMYNEYVTRPVPFFGKEGGKA